MRHPSNASARSRRAALALALDGGAIRAAGGQKWAIDVGVDRYDSDQASPLRWAGADAQAAKALVEAGRFPADNVVVMTAEGRGSGIRWGHRCRSCQVTPPAVLSARLATARTCGVRGT